MSHFYFTSNNPSCLITSLTAAPAVGHLVKTAADELTNCSCFSPSTPTAAEATRRAFLLVHVAIALPPLLQIRGSFYPCTCLSCRATCLSHVPERSRCPPLHSTDKSDICSSMTEFPRDHRQRRLFLASTEQTPGERQMSGRLRFCSRRRTISRDRLIAGGTCATAGLPVACGKKNRWK